MFTNDGEIEQVIKQGGTPPTRPPRQVQQLKGDMLVESWKAKVKTGEGGPVRVWVKEENHKLLSEPIYLDQQEGHAEAGKANYLADLQRSCPTIRRFVDYFETGELPPKGP